MIITENRINIVATDTFVSFSRMFCLNIVLSLRVDVDWGFVLEIAIVECRRFFYVEKCFVFQVIFLLPYNIFKTFACKFLLSITMKYAESCKYFSALELDSIFNTVARKLYSSEVCSKWYFSTQKSGWVKKYFCLYIGTS